MFVEIGPFGTVRTPGEPGPYCVFVRFAAGAQKEMPVEPVSFGQGGPPGGPVRQDAPARALLLAAGNRKGTQGRVRGLKVSRFDSVAPPSFNPP